MTVNIIDHFLLTSRGVPIDLSINTIDNKMSIDTSEIISILLYFYGVNTTTPHYPAGAFHQL